MGGAGGGSGGGLANTGGSGGAAPFALTSPSLMAHADCSKDKISACDTFLSQFFLPTFRNGGNHSPELDWSAGPQATLSYALLLHDDSNNFTHWAIWNIPASARQLPASLANGVSPAGLTGAKQLGFYGTKDGYSGPGAAAHVYEFKLYALKVASIAPATTGTNPQNAIWTTLEASSDVLASVVLRGATPP
jgi:phosphatidylethanolamine-binding protein (PEBP) family uncharacterized protein